MPIVVYYISINNFYMDRIWYQNLVKPSFTPNGGIFAPVWSILYFLIFLSLIFFILTKKQGKLSGYIFFSFQILLNFLWYYVFFIRHNILLSFFVIMLLLIFIVLNIISFYKVSKRAALLLIPYLLWVCFASVLNFGIMKLN